MNLNDYKKPGRFMTTDIRKIEYRLRCPLRAEFHKEYKADPEPELWEAYDQAFGHATLSLMTGTVPSRDSLANQVMKRLQGKGFGPALLDDMMHKKIIPMTTAFHSVAEKLIGKYNFVVPYLTLPLTEHGIELSVPVHFALRPKEASIKKTSYTILNYHSPIEKLGYFRLWMSAAEMSLARQGVSVIEVRSLDLLSGKLYSAIPGNRGIGREMIGSILLSVSTNSFYPRFGQHCRTCPFQVNCSEALSL